MSAVAESEEFISALNNTPAPRHSTLETRRVLAQRFQEPVEFKALVKHAERFGVEQVVETAIELGYGLDTVVRLQDICDRLEAAEHRRLHPSARPMKFPNSEKRVKALMDIVDEDDEVAA